MKKIEIIEAVCREFEVAQVDLRVKGRKPIQQVSDARCMLVYIFDKRRVSYPVEVQRMLSSSEGGYRAMLRRANERVASDAVFRHHLANINEVLGN